MKPVVAFLLILGLTLQANLAMAMDKGELIDAIASEGKLTKADAGRALDAFVNATTKALKKGDRVALVGFGSFSIANRAASANACASNTDIDFSPSAAFAAKKEEGGRHTPFHNKIARVVPLSNGDIVVIGPNNGVLVSKGNVAVVYSAAGAALTGASISGAVVGGSGPVPLPGVLKGFFEVDSASGTTIAGIVLSGVARTALPIGGYIETVAPPVFDDPIGACPDGGFDGNITTDADYIKEISAALPGINVVPAYNALLNTIVATVNAGDFVDAGGLGYFAEEVTFAATVAEGEPCAGLPENCPPTNAYFEIDLNVESGVVNDANLQGLHDTLDGICKRAARTGRNPQTGRDSKISSAKAVKFKAGTELATNVKK